MEMPKYIPGTALAKAIDAYDDARREFHRREHGSSGGLAMSDANKNYLAPMIMEAIVAWEIATHGSTELRGGLLT